MQIRCPVNGEVFKESNRVLILPTDEDFIDYEIIIENIIPESNISTSGQFLIAGKDIIGKADKSPCKRNCIHVSVRKKSPIQIRDSDYEYIDPSPFLDHLLPSPRWIWDCRERFKRSFSRCNRRSIRESQQRNCSIKFRRRQNEWVSTNRTKISTSGPRSCQSV